MYPWIDSLNIYTIYIYAPGLKKKKKKGQSRFPFGIKITNGKIKRNYVKI